MDRQTDAFPERLLEALKGISNRSFAERCGISEGTVRRYLKGDGFPTLDTLEKMAHEADVCFPWLATGEGPMRKLADGNGITAEDQESYADKAKCPKCGENAISDDFVLVPRYNVQASAGHGSCVNSEQVVDHLAFKKDWIRSLGLQAAHLALITAKGDSMEPTIKDGSLLLVDTREKEVSTGIYVIRLSGELIAKRVIVHPLDKSITVKSDNDTYPSIVAKADQVGMLEFVGKVVWFGQKAY
ncbi:XRE family transcriptional regulator [uncultured Desulfuromonas sp.]|uniref:XRE family transcriptional regulator n=1 Tax=uncultured Desulfuromonas sp. TaxID=181013 RepID=UPI002AAACDC6|nr:XRE family transcriptional regulator [uncultured Desulfuromonas sp.]